MRIGINGMGRIGRLSLRAAYGRHGDGRRTIRALVIASTSRMSTK